ncbi:AAA family ATPase [Nocardia gamkensis]|uniref:AAA family ATPase n=2 Tax=Nocardia gamkensis TaxID=352869 RepID=A0A7X6R792_9NOCA|nr:AAA family ATPase [Nocardia gamkensis]NKY31359.1 AAA family ATPase [Nocardia gamkensis]
MAPGPHPNDYPFCLPAVTYLAQNGSLSLAGGVTFLVGENGSGKSTLLEAIAVASGMNPEGGSQNYRFSTRSSESPLGEHLRIKWGTSKPRSQFFLRAETYYNVATETERLGPDQVAALGGVSPHQRSHGESFIDLMVHRFRPNGLYLLDEPEAALSPQGCMAVLRRLAELVEQRCQIVMATHSPILLALPGASIYEIAEDGTTSIVSYDDALPVRLTRDFLSDPDRYLRHLI